MKLSLVLVAGLVCATSVFGGVIIPKELHGKYYSPNFSKKEGCKVSTPMSIKSSAVDDGGWDCKPTKILSTANHEYKLMVRCSGEGMESYDDTYIFKKVNEGIIKSSNIEVNVLYKSCK